MPTGGSFVGRSRELAVLRHELEQARAGEPRLVWLTGEAGIGKTSLIRHFLEGVPGVPTLFASGDENEAALPYGVVAQLVADLPDPAPQPELRPDHDPLAVGADLLAALGTLEASGPLVVVVDDAQWSDYPSAQALVFTLRRLRRDHVLVILSARSDAPHPEQLWDRALAQSQLTTRLTLGGLTADDLRTLAPLAAGHALTPAASRRLHEHTGGHPLHARALLEELPAEALLDPWGLLPAPHSLSSLVLFRLSRLTADTQALVLATAVLGTRCSRSDVVRVAEVADPVAALDEAVRSGLLVEDFPGRLRDVGFPHALVRAAVYGDLPPALRHQLHARAADVVSGQAALNHRVAAVVGPDRALADELELLARSELAEQSWRSAAEHLTAAADLSLSAADRGARLAAAVAATLASGDISGAARHEAVLREAPASASRSRVLGQLALFTGRLETARQELSTALSLEAEAGADPAERVVAQAYLSLLAMIEGKVEEAADLGLEALLAGPPPEVTALSRFVVVIAFAAQGQHEELEGLIAAAAAMGLPGVGAEERAGLSGLLAVWSGRDQVAVRALSGVLRETPSRLLLQGRVLLLASLAEALYRFGDWDSAATQAELALSLADDAGVRLGRGLVHAVASYIAAGRGAWDEAELHVAAAGHAVQTLPWWATRAYAATSAAVLAQARGDHRAMREALRAFEDPTVRALVDGIGSQPWRLLLVESLLGLGRLDEAEEALREAEARAARTSPGWSSLEVLRLRAWLEELRDAHDAARAAYERGVASHDEPDSALSRARLETAYARFLLGHGERRAAADLLRRAHRRLERLRAAPYLAECEALFVAAGLRPSTEGAALDLTLQELAVARLVATGRTNAEVGGELFITSRTVAFHLSNIYAKAGISTRRDLAHRFPELLT